MPPLPVETSTKMEPVPHIVRNTCPPPHHSSNSSAVRVQEAHRRMLPVHASQTMLPFADGIETSSSSPLAMEESIITAEKGLSQKRKGDSEDSEKSSGGAKKRKTKAKGAKKVFSSQYRGVAKNSVTGRWESHLWDPNPKPGSKSRGHQVYLGGFKTEIEAANAYDRVAIKYWGMETPTNFSKESIDSTELDYIMRISREEVIAYVRRLSSGFARYNGFPKKATKMSHWKRGGKKGERGEPLGFLKCGWVRMACLVVTCRGASRFRGVTKHHDQGKWEARISQVNGNRYVYLGAFWSEEEAARVRRWTLHFYCTFHLFVDLFNYLVVVIHLY